jgi:YjbE family integral membrane protein
MFSSAAIGAELVALVQVLIIDLVLAGDNAIVVGLAVNGLPSEQRRRAIFLGVATATGLRIVFALVTLHLLAIIGLVFAGGLLLLWVCWRMYRELRRTPVQHGDRPPPKTMRAAMMQIVLADLSMSLDNVLAVAGAAREHPWVLVLGLGISVVLMGAAASLVARLLDRFRGLAWIGLAIVLYIALKMIWDGSHDIAQAIT